MGNRSMCCSADHVSMHMPQSPLASILFGREWHHVAIAIADYLRVRDLCALVEVCRLALASDLHDELLRRAVIFVRPLKRGQGVPCSMFRGSNRAKLRAFRFAEWADVATVQAAFPNLDRICIGYEFMIQEGESLDLNKSHRLTRLDLAMRFKTDPVLLVSLPHLEHLTIRRLNNASLICRLASLQHLVLGGSGINSIDFVRRTPRLEHLSLCETNELVDLSPLGRLGSGHRLKSINLSFKKLVVLAPLGNGALRISLRSLQVQISTILWRINSAMSFQAWLGASSTSETWIFAISHTEVPNELMITTTRATLLACISSSCLIALRCIDMTPWPLLDVTPLASCRRLETLGVDVTELSPCTVVNMLQSLSSLLELRIKGGIMRDILLATPRLRSLICVDVDWDSTSFLTSFLMMCRHHEERSS